MELLDTLTHPPPVFVWGLLSRSLGVAFFISFFSLAKQVIPVAGRGGVVPVHGTLRAIERDFPTWKRFLYFPTLLWFCASDGMLKAIAWGGVLCSAILVVGGPLTPWVFLACYVLYVSLDRPMHLVYPWDCMLFEAGFWGIFLPPTLLLPSVEAAAAPLPAVAWVYRLLAFRVILGFGKHKFFGTTKEDFGFLKSFMVGQPLPTPLGWLAQKLPMWFLKLSLVQMFLVEIPLPFLVFFPGPWCMAAAVAMLGLMVAIELTGNFGYFNLAMIAVALSWFDSETAEAFSFAAFVAPEGPVNLHRLVLLHTLLAFAAFPFNTFCAQTWMNWSAIQRVRPRFLQFPIDVVRFFQPFRLAHAYGVFPPHSPPAMKLAPVTEVSWDGEEWHPLVHRHFPTVEASKPTYCAPHHDRFDQAVVYEALGLNENNVYRNIVGRWDPYGSGGVVAPLMMIHRMLAGTLLGDFYDRSLEEKRGKPLVARTRTYMLEPTTYAEMKATGRWWRKTLVGPHFPPMRLEDGYFDVPDPPPELWAFEEIVWLRRSRLGPLMKRAVAGENVHALVLEGADGVTRADVDRFWAEFVPEVMPIHRESWKGVRATVGTIRARFGRPLLHRFERIAGRYGLFLFARLEPLFDDRGLAPVFGKVKATLDVKSTFRLRMLAVHVLGEGRGAYDAVLAEPFSAREHAARLTMTSGNVLHVLFRYETAVHQAQKLRLADACLEHGGRPEPTEKQKQSRANGEAIAQRLFGALELAAFLKTQFLTEEDVLDVPETPPHFVIDATCEVVRVTPAAPAE